MREFNAILCDVLSVSQEAVADGKSSKEQEFEIYGKLVNITDLEKATRKELQEQWGIPIQKVEKNAASGNIRVRMIDNERYILTSKIKEKDHNDEVEHEVGAALFEHFAKFADQGLRKVRHYFPVTTEEGEEFIYEVDAFYNASGQFSLWVKIDLEIPEGKSIDTLPDLPFEMESIRVIPPGKKSNEDLAFVRSLFDEHFNMPNRFIDHIPQVSVSSEDYKSILDNRETYEDLISRMRGATLAMTYNDADLEARVKHNLLETAMLLSTLLEQAEEGMKEEAQP